MWSFIVFLSVQESLEKAQLHAQHGDQLIQSNHYAVDSIRPKCVELRRICDDFSNEAKKKRDILTKSLEIHKRIDEVREATHILSNYHTGTLKVPYCQNWHFLAFFMITEV